MDGMRKYIDIINNVENLDESVFGDMDFKTGQTVNTPKGEGKIKEIADEDKKEQERTLTGHLGNDKRVMKRAKVDLKNGGTEWFPLFQLSK